MTGTIIVKRSLLPLDHMGEFFQAVVQVPFKIQGIGVWNAGPDHLLSSMQVGPEIATASGGYTPANFYRMPDDWGYSRLAAAIESSEVVPQSWAPEYMLAPGTMFRLRVARTMASIAASSVQIAIWGIAVHAYSDEVLKTFPQDSYYDMLKDERRALQLRIDQIEATLNAADIEHAKWEQTLDPSLPNANRT